MISIKYCDIEMKRQMRKFYANINILSSSPDVKCTAMRRLRIAYNNSLRRLLGIPNHNSASGMFCTV